MIKVIRFLLITILFEQTAMAGMIDLGSAISGTAQVGGVIADNYWKRKAAKQGEPFAGYSTLGMNLGEMVRNKMANGGSEYEGNFNLNQPNIERATEGAILGQMGNAQNIVGSNAETSRKLYEANKANLNESFDQERKKTNEMYNRLGLSSSTPGLQAQSDLNRQQAVQENQLSTQIMYDDISRNLQAEQLANTILNQAISQGQVLGQAQRGYDQYANQMSYQDWQRQINEPYQWATLGEALFTGNQPTTVIPNYNYSALGQGVGNLAQSLLGNNNSGGGSYPYASSNVYSGNVLGSNNSLAQDAANYMSYGKYY